MKLHALLDLRGQIPKFIRITPARVHDVNMLDQLTPEAGTFYIMDRGYLNFERLYRWTLHVRLLCHTGEERLPLHPSHFASGRQEQWSERECDQTVTLAWFYSPKAIPAQFRRIRYWDA